MLFFDGVVREQIGMPVQSPDHPLDTGRFIQDHTIHRPETLDADFIVTESPLISQAKPSFVDAGSWRDYAPRTASGPKRPAEVVEMLRQLKGRLLTIYSPRHGVLDDYQIMSVMARVGGPRRREDLSVSFKEALFARSETILVPAVERANKMQEGQGEAELDLDTAESSNLGDKSMLLTEAENAGSLQALSNSTYDFATGLAPAAVGGVGGF